VVHVREVPRDRGTLARSLFRAVDRTADRLLCNSRFTADLVARLAPGLSDRLRVVPDGIEPLSAAAVPPPDDGVLDVVCVGRIHPKKGHTVLFEAARIAADSGRAWRLHLWGDALPEHRELHQRLLRQAERAGIADRVHWHGFSADTERMYLGMDVAVVPSVLPEEFSLVTAEAQMMGLPVVATGPGGPSDILREGTTGLVVAPGDARALARAVMRIEDLPDRRAWGAAGRRRVMERFTVARYAPAVAAELEAALSTE
jgi:glycosyltransferase involved in cell wall biosynthesis